MTSETVTEPSANGGCLCGAIRFEAQFPSKWCSHCHCTLCRKAHGAGFVTWVGFEEKQVELHDPSGQLQWFESTPGARRGFCTTCGSTMFFTSVQWPGELHIAVGCVDGELDRAPQANVFYDTHVDWVPTDPGLKNIGASSDS